MNIRSRSTFGFVLAGLLFLVCLAPGARAGDANDTARFLAGMPVSAGSPLADLAEAPSWQQHSGAFNSLFKRVDERQFARVRAWSKANVSIRRPTLFYFFSGPDYLYANAFYPSAKTYILAGLEPPGAIPNLNRLGKGAVPASLRSLQVSVRSIMSLSFFKTIDMKTDFTSTPLNGTIPLLYVFLARSGKLVQDATLVRLGGDGSVHPDGEPDQPKGARGVKITFSSPGGPQQTLYYFGTNLANDGFKKAGFDQFCASFGDGNAFVKSASYLMHSGGFSQVRSFLLQHSVTILQDDTGIPVTYFGSNWELEPFGVYMKPISLFAAQYQPKLTELFQNREKGPMNFGLGYRYQQNTSNLLLAIRKGTAANKDEAVPPKADKKRAAPATETDDAPPPKSNAPKPNAPKSNAPKSNGPKSDDRKSDEPPLKSDDMGEPPPPKPDDK